MMTKNSAANVALFLVVLAWPLMVFGIARQMGDPAPWVPQEVTDANHRFALAFLVAGALSLLAATGLALYAIREARLRAAITLAIAALPLVVMVVMLVISLLALLG